MAKAHEHDPDSGMPRHKETAEGKDRTKMEEAGGDQGDTVKSDVVVEHTQEDRPGKGEDQKAKEKLAAKFKGMDQAALDKELAELQSDVDSGQATPASKIKILEIQQYKAQLKEESAPQQGARPSVSR